MGDIQLGPVGSYITLSNLADYRYEFPEIIDDRQDVRTLEGSLYTYIGTGFHREIKMPLTMVTSSDRSLVNSWWKTATNLLFFENSDVASTFFNVRVMGQQEPFSTFVQPYFLLNYEGELILETI